MTPLSIIARIYKKMLFLAVPVILSGILFRNWFSSHYLSAGDWWYIFPDTARNLDLFSVWGTRHSGLGGSGFHVLWLDGYFVAITNLFASLSVPWAVYERTAWFFPIFIFSFISSYQLFRSIVTGARIWSLVSGIIYSSNTYILMILGGGQVGVGMSYAMLPLFFRVACMAVANTTHKHYSSRSATQNILLTSLMLAFVSMFDVRIGSIGIAAFLLYIVFFFTYRNAFSKIYLFRVVLLVLGIGVDTVLLHGYWLVPIILSRNNPLSHLGQEYSSADAFTFFSFADFSHAIGLLHPNWPENVFGKISFLQPEFLLIPILAFSSLWFLKKISKNGLHIRAFIIFFCLLGIIGSFLAKGTNPLWGDISLWLFRYLPGYVVYRDPTKFFVLVSMSYSILIPFSVLSLNNNFFAILSKGREGVMRSISLIVVCFFCIIWFLLHREPVLGLLGGTYASGSIPTEYTVLAGFLNNQTNFFRTLWVPSGQRFGYFSKVHPMLQANDALMTSSMSAMLNWFNDDGAQEQLYRWGIKYIIVPYDSKREIFLQGRDYAESIRTEFIRSLSALPWLTSIDRFSDIRLFQTRKWSERLSLEPNTPAPPEYEQQRESLYRLTLPENNTSNTLFFSERYDPGWIMVSDGKEISAVETGDHLISFPLGSTTSRRATIEYKPQRYVWIGLAVSAVTLFVHGIVLFVQRKYKVLIFS